MTPKDKNILTSLIVITCCCFCSGQSPLYQVPDSGIPKSDYTAFISQTSDGFYWFGNGNGLHRFDGQEVKHFSVSDPTSAIVHDQNIQSGVFEDQSGQLWFTTYAALHSYSPQQNTFHTFQIKTQDRSSIQEEYRLFHFDTASGYLWLRAGSFLWAFHPQTNDYRKIGGPTEAVVYEVSTSTSDNETIIWGAPWVNSKGIEYFRTNTDAYNFEKRDLKFDHIVTDLVPLTNNHAYLASKQGLQELAISQDTFIVTVVAGVDKEPTLALSIDSEHQQLWLAQSGMGLSTYSLAEKQLTRFINTTTGLSSNRPYKLYLDQKKNLWVSHLREGIDYFSLESSVFEQLQGSQTNPFIDLFLHNNTPYCLSHDGSVYAYTGSTTSTPVKQYDFIKQYPGLTGGRFYDVPEGQYLLGRQGLLWIGELEDDRSYTALEFTPFRGLYSTRGGPTLLITTKGVQEVNRVDEQLALSICRDFAAYSASDFLSIHALTDSSFLLSYRATEVWKIVYRNNQFVIDQKEAIGSDLSCAIRTNAGKTYFGSSNGLYELKPNGVKRIFSGNESLIDIWVNTIIEDEQGHLWLGTKQGLIRYSPIKRESRYFSKADGLQDDYFEPIEPLRLTDGKLLFVSQAGLVGFSPKNLAQGQASSKPYISDLWVNNIPYQESIAQYLDTLSLTYQQNTLSFRVGGKELQPSVYSGISYQLMNYEKVSNFVATGSVIRYPNLPPGEYLLKLNQINRNGLSVGEQTIDIIIAPPFYQTWWFRSMAVLATLLLIVSTYLILLKREIRKQNRLREQQAKISAERDRIAAELHDDIGGNLSSILYLTGGIQYARSQGHELPVDIDRIHTLTDDTIKGMRDMIWILDDDRSSLSMLVMQLMQLGKEFAELSNLSVQLEFQENLPPHDLTSLQKRNILMICKEGLQNIRKHAKAKVFTIRTRIETKGDEKLFVVDITDDGIGLNKTPDEAPSINHGNGINNMYNRAQAIQANLTLEAVSPTGTRLSISLPLDIEK